jgi:hypothetical protein
MHVARPRHARPVLGSYLSARSRRELERKPVSAPPETEVAAGETPAPPPPQPTVGRAWEVDTFTAPIRGRPLTRSEKFALGATVAGLLILAILLLRPEPWREDTQRFMRLAATAPQTEEETAAGFARSFLLRLGDGWPPEFLFQNVSPAFWPAAPGAANRTVDRIAEAFATLREHGRVLGVDLGAAPAPPSGAPPEIASEQVLPCTLEFADGTALRAAVRLTFAPGTQRWTVSALSVQPILP